METVVTRIEVISKVPDTRAAVRKRRLSNASKKIHDIFLIDVYTIDKPLTREQLEKIADVLANPVTQKAIIWQIGSKSTLKTFDLAIEVGFLPGVTDNVAHTAKEMIEDLLRVKFFQEEGVYTSQVTCITGKLSELEAKQIVDSLYNPLIQRVHIKNIKQFVKDGGMDCIVPKVTLTTKPNVATVNLDISDDELEKIGKLGIENPDGTRRGPLTLSLDYLKTIQVHFKRLRRNPTDIELESIAQTWSEHCKHTIFRDSLDELKDGLFKHYIKRATEEIRKKKGERDICVSVFTDNSGAIEFDDTHLVTHKVETHNTPSALDPFGGAVTGIVGVNRDTLGFGLGAKPAINYYGYCFADPFIDIPLFRDPQKKQKMLSSRRIMDGVVDGVNYGGNCSGIPTPQGFVYFDERFRGKPLVFVGTVGLIPKQINGKPSHVKKARAGDYIVMIGGRVGKDGIHGATFSSEALDPASPATAVQIGDPITQKKFSDAIVKEAREQLLYHSITDNGAGGLSSSVSEMAKESGGCTVELDKVPLKYSGLEPWEIWISESQERMTLAVPPKSWQKFKKLMQSRGVEATVIGEFTDSGKCIVKFQGKEIMNLSMEFLHEGLPKRQQSSTLKKIKHKEPKLKLKKDLTPDFQNLLSRLNIASYEYITQQYDHIVQGSLALPPLQGKGRVNSETTIARPVLSSSRGVVLSQGLYPTYSDIDTYHMAAASLDTAVRNIITAGADPDKIAILDNFCWPSGNDQYRLGQLKQAAAACYDYATVYQAPFISGKDSMFNDFKGFDKNGVLIHISIPPTLLITSMGIIDDISNAVSLDFKSAGDLIYILGETHDELGASEYLAMLGYTGNKVPKVNAERNLKLYLAYSKAVKNGLVASAISLTRGGLAVALAKSAIGGMLGASIALSDISSAVSHDYIKLFSESQGRILVSVAPENKKEFEKALKGNVHAQIGIVTENQKLIVKGKKSNVNFALDKAVRSYRKTFASL